MSRLWKNTTDRQDRNVLPAKKSSEDLLRLTYPKSPHIISHESQVAGHEKDYVK